MNPFLIFTVIVISLLLIAIAIYEKHVARPVRDEQRVAQKAKSHYESIDKMLNDLLY